MKVLFYILLILFLYNYSQAQSIELTQVCGYVKGDSMAIPFAHVYIKNTHRGTITDFSGFFSLAAKTGDTIVFSSVGFKKFFYVVPPTPDDKTFHHIHIQLEEDLILLKEIVILPWGNYEKFKEAFVKFDIPDDDLERAKKNLALINYWQLVSDTYSDASLNYKYFLQEYYNKMYYKGQYPPLNILNPFAWAKFFEALDNGELRFMNSK